jgi:hypothetical protein
MTLKTARIVKHRATLRGNYPAVVIRWAISVKGRLVTDDKGRVRHYASPGGAKNRAEKMGFLVV